MKILITGSNGFLGSNLARFFSVRDDYEVFLTSRSPCHREVLNNFTRGDLQDGIFVEEIISKIVPDVVINTASLVNVDHCEEDPELAYDLIVRTAENVAQSARRHGSRLIYISTDHLFAGDRSMYSENDIPMPVNQYGKMKLKAESKSIDLNPDTVMIRTNFFGWSPDNHPPTSAEWIYNCLKSQEPMNLFTDYYFTPIEVTYLAESIEKIAKSDFTGVINIAGSQRCSKYEFGIELAEVFGLDPSPITPCKLNASKFKLKAKRQQDLSISTEKFKHVFASDLPDLRESLQRFYETKDQPF